MRLSCSFTRRADRLAIRFALLADLALLDFPRPIAHPQRRRGLWESTCFEFFLGKVGEASYWEFNLSPAGHWNVFRFDSYRKGMQEEPAFADLPFHIERQPNLLRMHLTIDLDSFAPAKQNFRMAVSAVMADRSGRTTFWALAHPAPEPDFHHQAGFLISL